MSVAIERGYKFEIKSDGIYLSDPGSATGTATWSDAIDTIGTLLTTLNNGDPHFLVADFSVSPPNTWTLKTSIDGFDWVPHDPDQAGPTAASVTDTPPSVAMSDADGSAYMDEVAMWVGHVEFSAAELENLFDLGSFGFSLDQYEDQYGAPICWQATAKMSDGSVWRDSGSGPCPAVIRVPNGAKNVVVTDDGQAASPQIIEG